MYTYRYLQGKISFKYLPGDVVGNESKLQLNKWDGISWSSQTATIADNTMSLTADETTLQTGTLAEITARYVTVPLAKPGVTAVSQNTPEIKVLVYPNPSKAANSM